MFFSVIIPSYNRASMLKEAVESVLAQTFTDYEIIVIDDGSSDDTLQMLRNYPQVQVKSQTNRGPGAARNLGARDGKGEYLAFLDSDDCFLPWSLATYATIIHQTSATFIGGKHFGFLHREELAHLVPGPETYLTFKDYLYSSDEWRWLGASATVIQRDAFLTAGGFVELPINCEDSDLAMKLGESPGFIQIRAPYTFGYRMHDTQVTANLQKTINGMCHMIQTEQAGDYPGGNRRVADRLRILARHIRPLSLECLTQGRWREAWTFYQISFKWQVRFGRWRYLAGFPIQALKQVIRGKFRPVAHVSSRPLNQQP